jgi:hypothetical protein
MHVCSSAHTWCVCLLHLLRMHVRDRLLCIRSVGVLKYECGLEFAQSSECTVQMEGDESRVHARIAIENKAPRSRLVRQFKNTANSTQVYAHSFHLLVVCLIVHVLQLDEIQALGRMEEGILALLKLHNYDELKGLSVCLGVRVGRVLALAYSTTRVRCSCEPHMCLRKRWARVPVLDSSVLEVRTRASRVFHQ